ncbi:MAG: hypothetical protein NTZ32_08130 [Planctomycetales bacterium]|nr:hypothetical protein [Planctomycetales bacterium]
MKYQIKQLALGGILDQAISLLRNHFGLLFGIVATTIIPFSAILGLVQYSLIASGDRQTAVTVAGIASIFVGMPLTLWVNAAVIHAVASLYLSRSTTIGESFRHALRRLFPLLGTFILTVLAIMGGFILLIIPGVIFTFWFMLSQHVTVLEGIAGRAALGRSRALMKGNIGTVFVLGLVVGLINIGIGMGATVIPQPHVSIVVSTLAQGVTSLLGICSMVVFYFSCRCKLENFDLQVLADAVGAGAEVQPVD